MAFVTFIIISNKCLTTNTIMRQCYYLCNCKNYFHFKEDVKRPQIPSIASADQDDKELDDVKEELTNVEPENRRKGKDVLLSTNCTTEYLQHEDFAPLLEVCNSVNQISVPEGEGECVVSIVITFEKFEYLLYKYASFHVYTNHYYLYYFINNFTQDFVSFKTLCAE